MSFLWRCMICHLSAVSLFFFSACQNPAALLKQIYSLQSEKRDENSTTQIPFGYEECKKKDLIQVVSSTIVEPERPEYHLGVKSDAAGVPRSVELTVELPKVRSVSECQLSVSQVSGRTLPWTVLINNFRSQHASVHSWMPWRKELQLCDELSFAVLNLTLCCSAGGRPSASGGCVLFASGFAREGKRRHGFSNLQQEDKEAHNESGSSVSLGPRRKSRSRKVKKLLLMMKIFETKQKSPLNYPVV